MARMRSSHPCVAAWAIGIAAGLIRTAYALLPRTVRWDEPDYLILAGNLLSGRGYQVFGVPELIWPHGMPLLAAAPMAFGVPGEYALAVWHVIAGSLAVGLLFALVRDVTGQVRLALVAALLAAVSPALTAAPLYWGSLSEVPFLCLLLLGLWAAWRSLRSPRGGLPWASLLAGLAFGAGYLIRTESIAWWSLFLVLGVAFAIRRRHRWWPLVLFVLGFWVLAGPYVGYLHQHTGQWMLTGKAGINLMMTTPVLTLGGAGQDFAASLDSTGQEIMWLSPERFQYSWLDLFRENPGGVGQLLRANFAKAGTALAGPILGVGFLVLAAVGFAGGVWQRDRWREEAIWFLSLLPLGILFLSKVETRYLLPAAALALVWVARGVLHLGVWAAGTLPGRLSQRAWVAMLLAVFLLLGLRDGVQVARVGQAGLTPSHEEAGRWLAENSHPEDKVMSRNSEVGFYAGRSLVAFPDADWDQVLAYARARGATYLVTDDYELLHLRPQLSSLGNPLTAPPELEHLVTFRDGQRTTLVYRFQSHRDGSQ